MAKKTATRDRILSYIDDFSRNHGYPPTVREIASGVGLSSVGAVHRHIACLKQMGLLAETDASTPRALVLCKKIDRKTCDALHLCLKTDTGESIVLNCLPQSDCLRFEGYFCVTGTRSISGRIVACHELSDEDYDAIAERVN